MARWSIIQMAVVLTGCLAAAPAAEIGAAAVGATQDTVKDVVQDVTQDMHVRDKRRLPDPGFVIPATPMGFTKKQSSDQDKKQPGPVVSAGGSAPPQHPQAERKALGPPSSRLHGGRGSSSSSSGVTSFSPESVNSRPQLRQKKAPPPPYPGASASHPLGREEHVRALTSFLDQTRKLGVPDDQALKLLDKELAKAKRQQGAPGPSHAPGPRPVYHATPLKPYGSLINFNQAPYEKYQLKAMKPIKEQQNDIPPPSKPLVVESDRQRLPAGSDGKHTEAVVMTNGPLPVSVPVRIDPVHLVQAPQAQKLSPRPQYAYQTITVPAAPSPSVHSVHSYQQIESQSAAADAASHGPSETPVSLESLHSFPHPAGPGHVLLQEQEQHIQHQPLVSVPSQPIVSHPPAHAQEEVHQPQPVYVYQQEEVHIPQPQAEVHVELPSHVLTKQAESHHAPAQHGLYSEHQERPEEYASQYRFGYRVRDEHAGNDFGHAETREGKMTKGEYFVSLPDGRLQSVKYWADPSGYHAHVSYTSHAAHPQSHPQH